MRFSLRAGIPVTFSSDSIGEIDKWSAFYNMYYAVHRSSEDVMTVPSDKIKDVTVEKTFFRGNCIYEKGDSK